MDLETAQITTTAKLPTLKQENRNSFKPVAKTTTNADGISTTLIPGPVTIEEKTLFAAIQTRFDGNEATKKTQKTLLKKMYENFSAPSTESLDSIFNRLQKINKPDLDIMSFENLYNNFKIVEQEVKGTANSSSSSNSQNMAFVSSSSSTNEVNTAYGVSTTNTQVSPTSTQVSNASTQFSTANLSDDTVYAFLKTGRKITINGSDTAGYDNSRRTVNVEETSSKAMLAIDGAGFDWSHITDDKVPTNMALMAFSDYGPEFEGYGPKTSKNVSEDASNEVRESLDAPMVEKLVSADKLEKKTIFLTDANKNLGRTPALSFMRPFGCHVSILNTLDHLGKFDGKSDDGFFVGYSLTSKAFRVYNIRTRKVEENLHIRFLEDKPIVSGDGPKWLFDIDSLTKSMNYVPVIAGTNSNDFAGSEVSIGEGTTSKETDTSQDYIVMPLWKDSLLFDSPSMNVSHDKPEPSCDAEKKDDEGVSKTSGVDDQERPGSSTLNINTAGPSINTASANLRIDNVTPEATNADLFGDETEMDMSNLNASYHVPITPNTKIHKDHSLDYVIGDIQSSVQTREMTKTANEQGFLSVAYERKPHKDLNTCLFFFFLSQEEPKMVTKALSDSAWVEAIQEELLQFKLQKVWVFVDLPKGKRAIGTKWIFINKKDERGIVIRNKASLVIEEEVYVCQPLGFEDPDYHDKVYKVVKALYGLH
ncbi:putative reverse transcriptase, RNA-dependent DNA polymerase [Tanacetum coccineum]